MLLSEVFRCCPHEVQERLRQVDVTGRRRVSIAAAAALLASPSLSVRRNSHESYRYVGGPRTSKYLELKALEKTCVVFLFLEF